MKTTKFKPSEVGPIPKEWEVKPFSECFTLMRNNTYSRDCLTDLPGSVANVHYGDVLIRYEAVLDFEEDSVPCLKPGVKPNKDLLKDGDLIFADTAEDETAGKAVEVLGVRPRMAVAGLHTVACRPQDEIFAPRYLGYYINSAAYHNQLLPLMTGTKVTSISRAGFVSTHVAIPPKSEQEKIAEALSDVDGLLAAMTKLIEKKHAIKQGAMQQLLTGKTRLPGFKGKWVEKRLGEIGISVRGVSFKPDQSSQSAMPNTTMLLRANNVQDNRIALEDVLYVQDGCIADSQRLKDGDILICAANGSRNLVGKAAIWKQPSAATFGAFMAVFRCNEGVDSYFVGYLFQSVSYRRQLDDILTGSAINNLNAKDIEGLAFVFPVLAEQQAIAAVLSDMDAEIAALEAEHAKYESIKQGMMQELLTGRTRLM